VDAVVLKKGGNDTDCSYLFLKVLLVSLSTRETTLSSKILAKCLLAEQSLIIKESVIYFSALLCHPQGVWLAPKEETRSHLFIIVKPC